MKRTFFINIFFLLVAAVAAAQTPPPFNPLRTVNVTDTASLNNAIATAKQWDRIVLAPAVYTGLFQLNQDNVQIVSSTGPWVSPHAAINGSLRLMGFNTWALGLEIYTGNTNGLLDMNGPGQVAMGNYVHNAVQDGLSCFGAWAASGNQYIEFNVMHDCRHTIYTQNTSPAIKYFIGNWVSDVSKNVHPENAFNFHAYTESPNKEQQHYFKDNVISNGGVIFGGQNNATPVQLVTLVDSVLYNAGLDLGYKRPVQATITGCNFFRSLVNFNNIWGAGEVIFPYPGNNTFTGNVLFNPGLALALRTCAYVDPCSEPDPAKRGSCARQFGPPALRPGDTWNNNTYAGGFAASFYANNNNVPLVNSLSTWQSLTAAAGNQFDSTSTVTAAPPPDGYKLIPSGYDSNVATLAVWNFSGASSVTITLPQAAAAYNIKDGNGAPVATLPAGTFAFNQSAEFAGYILKFIQGPQCDQALADAKMVEAINLINQKKYARARTAIQQARAALAPCECQ